MFATEGRGVDFGADFSRLLIIYVDDFKKSRRFEFLVAALLLDDIRFSR
jgi:hypothetical protein